ncbi:MAG: HAD family hydrolase [Acidimicrobiaceae bacterium]|nr:HAD family hydrolase [Acidimicrobiaceae bacterium]MYG98371.1 HAD family hydrolase [Acidimicrobiaceae bacterium]MYL03035.1 HAD family hydrolase [Acidimicrobiaceae bacterium]
MDLAVDGLVFDLDDTLFDFRGAFVSVVRDFYEQHLRATTSVSHADAVAMMVRWDEDLHAVTQYVPDLRARRFARWLSEWPDVDLDISALTEWYDDAMDRQMQPDPEINRFLADLNDLRIPWGIVTNGPSRMQRHKCEALGLDRMAPFIIVSEEVGYAKPDPRIFRDAFAATRLARPAQVMFVGDNPVSDIDGARCFGMRTAWVRRGRQFPADLQPPDHTVDSVTEVRYLLDAECSPEEDP